ncbi:MAG: hypothetical protein QF682_13130 [Candidatus Thermoplasmatota archaeon]|nr:hypothetical protein [Candidatus Thermoplasmatota archaeon]
MVRRSEFFTSLVKRKRVLIIIIVLLSFSGMGCILEDRPLERSNQNVGDLAYDILNPANHPKIWIEIDWMMGVEPDYTKSDLFEPLDAVMDIFDIYSKRTYVEPFKANNMLAIPHDKAVHSLTDIKQYESLYRTFEITAEVFSIYILYVNGTYAADPVGVSTLGLAFTSSSIVIFKEAIDNIDIDSLPTNLGIDEHRDIEKAVLLHEMGHLLGFSDTDVESGVMHSSVDSTRFIDEIKGIFPKDYSLDSKNELKNTLTGIKKTKVERIQKGGSGVPTLSVEFFPACDLSGSDSSVKAEYWLSGDEHQETTMKKSGKKYTTAPVSYSPATTIHYRIKTIDAKGNTLVSSEMVKETDSIPLVETEEESPGFGLVGLFVIIAIMLLYLSVTKDRNVGRKKR